MIDSWDDVLIAFLQHQAILGAMLMVFIEEAGVPLPLADVVITYIGYKVSQGYLSYQAAFLLLLFADLAGTSVLYWFSSRYGQKLVLKSGKYIHLNKTNLLLAEKYYKKYGPLFIIFGRHIPGFRVPTTVFAGMSGVSYPVFIGCLFLSVVWWVPFYLSLGERLGPRAEIYFHAHTQFAWIFLLFPVIALVILFFILRKKQFSKP